MLYLPSMSKDVETYLLSPEDFKLKSGLTNKAFHPEDRVTRGNFVQFIIWSFAISQGVPQAQASAMEWIRQHNGFDYQLSIENFGISGGISCLTEIEKQMLLTSIKGVKKHKEKGILEDSNNQLLETIASQFASSTDYGVGSMTVAPEIINDLDWTQFHILLKERIVQKLEYDRERSERESWWPY